MGKHKQQPEERNSIQWDEFWQHQLPLFVHATNNCDLGEPQILDHKISVRYKCNEQ